MDWFVPRFEYYNQYILRKLRSLFPDVALPADAADIVCGTDGTRLRTCRLGGNNALQAAQYNGNDKIHCLQFQHSCFPDDMVGDLFGSCPGNMHDARIHNLSGFTNRLAEAQVGNVRQFKSYDDKAYVRKATAYLSTKRR